MKKYISMILTVCMVLAISPVAYAITPRLANNRAWNQNSVKCYIDPNIMNTYGTSVYTAIGAGITSWNVTEAPSVTLSDDFVNWDVIVEMADYGETGWDGQYEAWVVNGTTATDYVIINLNVGHLRNYVSDGNLWKAIVCHEMGHAHGLDHNTTDGEYSILKTHTSSYYNYSGTWPRWVVPQSADRIGVNNIY